MKKKNKGFLTREFMEDSLIAAGLVVTAACWSAPFVWLAGNAVIHYASDDGDEAASVPSATIGKNADCKDRAIRRSCEPVFAPSELVP